MRRCFLSLVFLIAILSGCTVYKGAAVNKKYSPGQLFRDYTVFRQTLETYHPGLYWYTSKDSMDYYFTRGETMLLDSMTESSFRKVLCYVTSKIRCGHTQVKPSLAYEKATRKSSRFFPLTVKIWKDTAVVTSNLNRQDSSISRSVVLESIDHHPIDKIIDSLFEYLPADGYNLTHKYQTLSNRGVFGNLYTWVFGWKQRYAVDFVDTSGSVRSSLVSTYIVTTDSAKAKKPLPPVRKISAYEKRMMRLENNRSLRLDSTEHMAVMDLGTFTKGYELRRFFRSSFKTLRQNQTPNLVIDLRGNGGGSVVNSSLLTKYIADHPFKIADSLYALRRNKLSRYQQNRFFIWLFLQFMTHRKADGHYHFTLFERKYFHPKKHNHYNGNVYILAGGNTFSASTLFIQSVKPQQNVLVVGEETGGGAYGNNAWVIPDVTLPSTRVRFRLPLFRLVINKNLPKDGRGVLPELEARPTVEDIRKNVDFKMEKVKELIRKGS